MQKRGNSCSSMRAPLAPPTKLSPPQKKLHPSILKENIWRQQSERKGYRLFYETLAQMPKTMSRTQRGTITNLTAEPVSLHCSHHDLNVSIHDGICLRLSVSEATNYLSFVSTIVCFIDTLFNVSINNIVVTNAALAWGVDSTCGVHGC